MTRVLKLSLTAALAAGVALPAYADIQSRSFSVSNGVAETHPVADGVDAMRECFDERTDGQWTLNAFWSSALGDDLEATQALRSGTLEMVITSTSPLVGLEPALGVFDLPFLFDSNEEADAILDGEFGEFMTERMEPLGLINLAYWENGFRNLTNSVRLVDDAEDIEGMRVRVMQNQIFLDTFQNLGANAMPMAFGEVFTALETGAIDAQENPYVTIRTSQFYDVQRYLTETRHAYTPFMVLFSGPIWQTLSEDEQEILVTCAEEGRDVQRQVSRERSDEALEYLRGEGGMEFSELSPEALEQIREAVAPVYERHAQSIGQEVVDRMMAALEEHRNQ
jgi:TRAP-type transport system periplasmic protein